MRFFNLFSHRYPRPQRRYGWVAIALSVALGIGILGTPAYPHGRAPALAIAANLDRLNPAADASAIANWQDELDTFLPPTPLNPVAQQVVRFDGQNLFRVGVLVPTGGKVDSSFSVTERVRQIRTQLYEIARSSYDPDTLAVTVGANADNEASRVIYVDGRYLMTVTSVDVQIAGRGIGVEERAAEMRDIIESALIRYKRQRTPRYVMRQAAIALGLASVLGLVVLGLDRWQRRLSLTRQTLRQALKRLKSEAANTSISEGSTGSTDTALHQQLLTQRRSTAIEVAIPLLWATQILVVGVGAYSMMGLIPYTRWIQPILLALMPVPLKLLGVAWGTFVLIRVGSNLIDRALLALQDRITTSPETSQRIALRFSTFASVMTGVLAFVAWGSAILIGLAIVGIQIAPLLAGAGIIGLGISFASQSLIKDIINGFFILLEDQYGVGDVVVIGEVSGFVEEMNLRITQLRNEEGRLITIPNNTITVVQNLSKEWSRVDLMIDVAPYSDLDAAIALIKEIAERMTYETYWRGLILEPPLLLGVDRLDYRGATVRMWIKTQPLKQWDVAREYRRRLKLAFDAAGIDIGVPQQRISWPAADSGLAAPIAPIMAGLPDPPPGDRPEA